MTEVDRLIQQGAGTSKEDTAGCC